MGESEQVGEDAVHIMVDRKRREIGRGQIRYALHRSISSDLLSTLRYHPLKFWSSSKMVPPALSTQDLWEHLIAKASGS